MRSLWNLTSPARARTIINELVTALVAVYTALHALGWV